VRRGDERPLDLGCHMNAGPSAPHTVDDAESMREEASPLLELLPQKDIRHCPDPVQQTHLRVVSRDRGKRGSRAGEER
jgi:hypothetical protein